MLILLLLEAFLQNTPVPLPAAYTRQVSYDSSKRSDYSPSVYSENKRTFVQSPLSEFDSLKGSYQDEEYEGEDQSTAKRRQSVLILLLNSRLFFRVLIVLVMCTSLALVLTAVIKFALAQKKPSHPLSSIPQNAPITDHPCIVFSGVAVMNLFLSVSIFIIACKSSKVFSREPKGVWRLESHVWCSSARVTMQSPLFSRSSVLLVLQRLWVLVFFSIKNRLCKMISGKLFSFKLKTRR